MSWYRRVMSSIYYIKYGVLLQKFLAMIKISHVRIIADSASCFNVILEQFGVTGHFSRSKQNNSYMDTRKYEICFSC